MHDLLEERRRFEQYTREQNARLTRLRDLITEEKANARADLEKSRAELVATATAKLRAELDDARQLLQEHDRSEAHTNAEHAAALAEMKRMREQLQEVSQLRKELERIRAESAQQKAASQSLAALQNELASTRAELDILRQRDATRLRELEELRGADAHREAIVAKAQELCQLISEISSSRIPT
jgi:hypothetical protein